MAKAYCIEQSAQLVANGKDKPPDRVIFKDFNGSPPFGDLPLPGLIKLRTGSCDAVFLRPARNYGFGFVPIQEYIRDKQTIVDKTGTNGTF